MLHTLVPERAGNRSLLESQAARESNARSYPRRLPLAIQRAEGIHVTDMDGKTYYDCLAGAGTLALGHNHPAVVDAIKATLDQKLPLHTLDITTPLKEAFVDELFASLPQEFAQDARVHFAPRPAPTPSKQQSSWPRLPAAAAAYCPSTAATTAPPMPP